MAKATARAGGVQALGADLTKSSLSSMLFTALMLPAAPAASGAGMWHVGFTRAGSHLSWAGTAPSPASGIRAAASGQPRHCWHMERDTVCLPTASAVPSPLWQSWAAPAVPRRLLGGCGRARCEGRVGLCSRSLMVLHQSCGRASPFTPKLRCRLLGWGSNRAMGVGKGKDPPSCHVLSCSGP